METQDRAQALAHTAQSFTDFLGPLTPDDLLALVAAELGHPAILDDFQPVGPIHAQAVPAHTILHIISGNTPHAGLQSLLRGLLLGTPQNLCKIPSAGLPEIVAFKDQLPKELAATITIETQLPDPWLARANALIVFGTDETISHFHRLTRPGQTFIAHGPRISFGVVFDPADPKTPALAARDASLFDQQGCLSPLFFYIRENSPGDALSFAAALGREMEAFNNHTPAATLTPEHAAAIADFRTSYQFRAANDPRVRLWTSADTLDWTVIFEDDPHAVLTPAHRVVLVKPLPENLDDTRLNAFNIQPSAIGLAPFNPENARALQSLRASRYCPLGQMQHPTLFWHQDGQPILSPLVHWIDQG